MRFNHFTMNTEPFRQRLQEEKAKLESELAHLGRKNPSVPNDWEPQSENESEPDPLDQAERAASNEADAAVFSDLEARYDDVLTALAAIDGGTYGICATCGTTIPEERLRADPAARVCVAHAQ